MFRRAPVGSALVLLISITGSAGAASLLVLNKGNDTLAIVDTDTLQVKGTIPSGPAAHEVIASADGRLAYISNTRGATEPPARFRWRTSSPGKRYHPSIWARLRDRTA